MKIALIHTPLWGRGGAERQVLTLAIELQKLGNKVEIFTPALNEEACYPEMIKQLTVNVLPKTEKSTEYSKVGKSPSRKSFLGQIAADQFYTSGLLPMHRLGKMIPKGFNVINNHNAPTEWAAFTAKRKLKAPIVWMCNEPPAWFFPPQGRKIKKALNWPLFGLWDRISVDYIDEILVLSNAAGSLVKKAYDKPYRIIRTGLDAEKFYNVSGNEVRKKNGLEGDFVMLQVSNLSPFKRQIDAITALSFLAKKYSNVKLILDGYGPAETHEELKKLSEKLGVEDRLLIWDTKSDTELAKVYAACDVFVFPGKITWGLAVVEAMASGKPVVVSRGCGASEIIHDNINGMLFNHTRPEEIAQKVEILINDAALRASIAKKGFEYVKNNLSWKNYAKNMESIFLQSIQRHKAS